MTQDPGPEHDPDIREPSVPAQPRSAFPAGRTGAHAADFDAAARQDLPEQLAPGAPPSAIPQQGHRIEFPDP